MSQERGTTIVTLPGVVAQANLAANKFCTAAGAVPAAGVACGGVVNEDVDTGDDIPVCIGGLKQVLSGAAFATATELKVDNQGRVIALTSGKKVGTSYGAAGAADQLIWIRVFA